MKMKPLLLFAYLAIAKADKQVAKSEMMSVRPCAVMMAI